MPDVTSAQPNQPPAKPATKPEPNKPTPVATTPEPPKSEPKAKPADGVTVSPISGAVPGREFRGVCDVCGWQTHQPREKLAVDAVKDHSKKHNQLR